MPAVPAPDHGQEGARLRVGRIARSEARMYEMRYSLHSKAAR